MQQDYILFAGGLAFLILGVLLWDRNPGLFAGFQWRWLACFGFLRSFAFGCHVASFSAVENAYLTCAASLLELFSDLALLQFGLANVISAKGRKASWWVIVALLGCMAVLKQGEGADADALQRYAVAVPAALLAAYAIGRAALRERLRFLFVSAGALLAQAGMAAFRPWPGSIAPGGEAAGLVPGDALWTACALVLLAGIWPAFREPAAHVEFMTRLRRALFPVTLILLLMASWWAADSLRRMIDQDMRDELLTQCRSIAQTIDVDQAKMLAFDESDLERPEFLHMRRQMMAYSRASGLRSIYTMAIRDGNIVFGPESLAESDPYASPPGTVYEDPSPQDWEIFETGVPMTMGPETDEYGTFISASAPIKDHRTDKVFLVVGIDIEATSWARHIYASRRVPIVATLGLVLLLLVGRAVLRWRERLQGSGYPWMRHAEALLTFTMGLGLTVALALLVVDYEKRGVRSEFRRFASSPGAGLVDDLRDLGQQQLMSLAHFFESSSHVTREEFASFARPLTRHAAVQGFDWVPRVKAEDVPAMEAAARKEGFTDFSIFDRSSSGVRIPLEKRDTFYPIYFIEPMEGNESVLGYALGKEPMRLAAMNEAMQSGLTVATDPLTLINEGQFKGNGLLVFHPVYSMPPPDNPADRTERLRGFAVAALRINELIKTSLAEFSDFARFAHSEFYHLHPTKGPRLMASYPIGPSSGMDTPGLGGLADPSNIAIWRPVFAFGKSFALIIRPAERFQKHQSTNMGWLTVFVGLLFTSALTAFVAYIAQRRAKLEEEVRARTTELRESERRYRTLFSTMQEGFALHEIICDDAGKPVDFRFIEVNPAFEEITGLKRDAILGSTASTIMPGLGDAWIQRFGDVALSGRPCFFEDYAGPLGRFFEVSAYSPKLGQFATVFSDITERRQAEDKLRTISRAVEQSPASIVVTDSKGDIQYVNPKFTEVTGYTFEEVSGRNPRVLKSGETPPETYKELWDTLLAGREWHGELLNRNKQGELFWEWASISPVRDKSGAITHFVAVKENITERKHADDTRRHLEQQLLQSQKMETVGRLAGGVAHDFNNLLQAILGFTELLMESGGRGDSAQEDLQEIRKAASRARDLTRQLLAFSRKQMLAPQDIQLNDLIDNSQRMLRRLIGEDIALETRLRSHLWMIRADPGQIEQVIMNLTVNARDAMPKGGRLSFTTENVTFRNEDVAEHTDARPGDFVCMAVSDTGEGMTTEVMSHIFEPFFTTKGAGHGTGLGLATIYGIVRQHEGWVHVYSQVGLGSTFKVYLPALKRPTEAGKVIASSDDVIPRGKGQHVLLVEDEDGVRNLAYRTLTGYGYNVRAAACAMDALKLYEDQKGDFDIAVCDVVLPDMNGLELSDQLRQKKPTLKLILTSGYTDEKSRWPEISSRGITFIQKPFPVKDLLRAVHRELSSR